MTVAAAKAVVIRDLSNRSNLRRAVTIAVTDDADHFAVPPFLLSLSPKITLISIALCFRGVAPLDPKFRSRRRRRSGDKCERQGAAAEPKVDPTDDDDDRDNVEKYSYVRGK